MKLLNKIPLVILSACILHNFILVTEKLDIDLDLEVFEDEAAVDDPLSQHEDAHQPINIAANNKRDALANLLG